jgi:hypothetical protein
MLRRLLGLFAGIMLTAPLLPSALNSTLGTLGGTSIPRASRVELTTIVFCYVENSPSLKEGLRSTHSRTSSTGTNSTSFAKAGSEHLQKYTNRFPGRR